MNDRVTLELNPETVGYVANLAREFQEQASMRDQSVNEAGDWKEGASGDYQDDPIHSELKTTIEDLEPDQQVQLVALMWLGRGSFTSAEWANALKEAGDNWTPKSADYLIGTPLLADYLEEGLSQLEYHHEDFEV